MAVNIENTKDLDKYGVRSLFEWYIVSIQSKTLEEHRNDPKTMQVQKEIEKRLREYEKEADIYGRKRKSDSLILGKKKR